MADKSLAIEDDVLDKWLNSLDIAAVKESFSKQGYLVSQLTQSKVELRIEQDYII